MLLTLCLCSGGVPVANPGHALEEFIILAPHEEEGEMQKLKII